MRQLKLILATMAVASVSLTGCTDKSDPPEREPEGRRIKVDAPYTDVDVYIPDDD